MHRRTKTEIEQAESEAIDRVWYDRHMHLEHDDGGACCPSMLVHDEDDARRGVVSGCEGAEKLRQKVAAEPSEFDKTFEAEPLGPYSDYEWGRLNGRLETLRWLGGEDWGALYD